MWTTVELGVLSRVSPKRRENACIHMWKNKGLGSSRFSLNNLPDSYRPKTPLSAALGKALESSQHVGIRKTTGTEQKTCAKNAPTGKGSSASPMDSACPLLLDLLGAVLAPCYLGMTVITEPECSSAETDRALSRGVVAMAIASASE